MGSAPPQQKDIQALAAEIVELSKTYDPNATFSSLQSPLAAKANELITAIQRPQDLMTSILKSILEGTVMRTLLSLGAVQAIPPTGSITLTDLSKTTGAQAALLERLLRALIAANIINQDPKTGAYSHTPFSAAFGADEAGVASQYSFMFDEAIILTGFPEYFKQRGAREPDGEMATTHNPRTWYYGQEGKTVFEILEMDPERMRVFQKRMVMATRFRPYTGFYDFGKLVVPGGSSDETDRVVLVDVGGGDGTTIAKILEAHPEIRAETCVLQDRESVIEIARTNDDLPKGVHLQAYDFFEAQPVHAARGYLLRAICHDWSDTMVIKILSIVAKAAARDSKLLIADVVLPTDRVSGMAAFMDLGMLAIGGKERTKANFEHVLDASGWKLDAIHPTGYDSGFAIVEASLK